MNNKNLDSIYNTLLNVCIDNKLYFEKHKDEKSQKLFNGFVTVEEQIENLLPLLDEIQAEASSYDFKDVPANGFRSFIKAADKFFYICFEISKDIRLYRSSLFFQKAYYAKEIEHCVQVFSAMNDCFQLLQLMKSFIDPQTLFLSDLAKIDAIEQFINRMDVKSFYSRFIGFQYGESTQPIIKTVAIMMAAFSHYYFDEKNVIQCAAAVSQYFANPDLRAERLGIITAYRRTTVYFCKSFWNLSEHDILKKMNVVLQPIHFINEVFQLPLETMYYKVGDHIVDMPVPSVYLGTRPLTVRLLSTTKRQGMEHFKRISENKSATKPASDWFVFHIHGGGFISQTSESHQIYLKNWSKWTDGTPILSVDYSLAPEAPYPRALDELLFAYVWALNNTEKMGTTAKRIVFAGDSAGGNLCMSLVLKCIELNIRKPDGIFSAYGPTVLQFYPSPSRFLGFMDPLLSFGFMMCSIKGYVHSKNLSSPCTTIHESDLDRGSFISDQKDLSFDDDDFAEKESTKSPGSDIFEATDENYSPLELSLDSEQNLDSPIADMDSSATSSDEMTLPLKCKNIIKGFPSKMKDKIVFNSTKNENYHFNHPPDFESIPSISYLMREAQDTMFLSPAKAGDTYLSQFPRTSILTVEMDPCLDDCVTFARKLDKLQKEVFLDVLPNMAHGFLNVSLSSKEAYHGSMLCAQRIKELLSDIPHDEFKKKMNK